MFSGFTREKLYTDRIHSFYFDKDNGAIVCTSALCDNVFFEQLQQNVNYALKPLIELIKKAANEEMTKYSNLGGMFSGMPDDHPASILLNLRCILEANNKFYGRFKKPLPRNAIQSDNSYNSIDTWANALASLTGVDYKEAYKFLLKINACKEKYDFVDSMAMPFCDQLHINSRDNENYYKTGIDEIISFADFQKKIDKSIAYIVSKANQVSKNQYNH